MSLINDALKKSSSNKINPRGRPPIQPTADEPKSGGGGGKGFTVFLICFVLAGAGSLGAWNYWNKAYKGDVTADGKSAGKTTLTTNNNPIARAANVFNKVFERNKEGEKEAAAMQNSSEAGA